MVKIGKSEGSLPAGESRKHDDRIVKLAFAALIGAVGGGALGMGALSVIRPLYKVVRSSGAQLGFVVAAAALGGTSTGAAAFLLTRPKTEKKPDGKQQKSSSSSTSGEVTEETSSSTEGSDPTASDSQTSSLEKTRMKEFEDQDAAVKASFEGKTFESSDDAEAAIAVVQNMFDERKEALGETAAGNWLTAKDGTVEILLKKISIALPPVNSKTKIKPAHYKGAALRLASLKRTVNTINELGSRVTEGQVLAVMRTYEALANAFGEELTAHLVGRTYPILEVADPDERRTVMETPRRDLDAGAYVDLDYEYLRRMRLPKTQESQETIETARAAMQEGWHLQEHPELMRRAFERLVQIFGSEAQALELVGDVSPASFQVRRTRRGVTVDVVIDQEALEQRKVDFEARQAQQAVASQASRDPRADEVRPETVGRKWAGLPALAGEERVDSEKTPFPAELWLLGLGDNDRWKVLIGKSAEHENPRFRLGEGDFRTVRKNTRHLREQLQALVDKGSADLPKGYAAPLEEVAGRMNDQLKAMHELAKGAMSRAGSDKRPAREGIWGAEQKVAYDAARHEARWCVTELKNTLLLIEQKIGVDARYCEHLTTLINGIVSLPKVEEDADEKAIRAAHKAHRESLRVEGEKIRDFWADHKNRQQRADVLPKAKGGKTLNGGEGSMEDLLQSSYYRLQREGLSHDLLHIQIRGKEWPEDTFGARDEWVPVSFSLLTREESGGASALDGTLQARDIGGQHYVTYIETAERETVRCDNLYPANQVRRLGAEARRTSPGQLYVHATAIEAVRPALADAERWSTLKFRGNNCWISATMMLLAAHHKARAALMGEEASDTSSSESS